MKAIFLVGGGGFVGSVLRYLLSGWLYEALGKPWFPIGTLVVNLLGCLAIGFLGGYLEARQIFTQEIRLLVFVGVLGGFTTFSAFAYETTALFAGARLWGAWLNVGLQVIGGLMTVWLGAHLARRF